MKGGYVMIDASGLNMQKTAKQTISGIYKKTLDAKKTNKPIFIYNAVFGDDKISAFCVFCNFAVDNESIVCTTSSLQIITIDKNDGVTITLRGGN